MNRPISFALVHDNIRLLRRFRCPWVQLISSCLLLLVLTACDNCTGDHDRIISQAQLLKGNAADATNILLYIKLGTDVEIQELVILQRIGDAESAVSHASQPQKFSDLRGPLASQMAALEVMNPAIRDEIGPAIGRAAGSAIEVIGALAGQKRSFARDRSALGTCAASLDDGLKNLDEALGHGSRALSGMDQYLMSSEALLLAVRGQIRELDHMSSNTSLQGTVATIARLIAFSDETLKSLSTIAASAKQQINDTEAGVESLLRTFKSLQRLPDLPPDLEREIQDAIKLLEDVKAGRSFRVK